MYKILGVFSKTGAKTFAKPLAKTGAHWGQQVHCDQPVNLSDIYRQTALTARGISTLPNILRQKCKKFSKERPGPVVGGLPVNVSALGLLHQTRNSATATQQDAQETSGEGSENKKEKSKDRWYSGGWKLRVYLHWTIANSICKIGVVKCQILNELSTESLRRRWRYCICDIAQCKRSLKVSH